jgi:integrase
MAGAQPYLIAKFLDWAHANRRCRRLTITRPPRRYLMAGGIPDEDRGARLAAVLDDDCVPPGTKLAAALVLLFGISPLRISRLRLSDVQHHEGTVAIRIGKAPLELPGTLAVLAADACADRSARRMLGPAEDQEWLFPGSRPRVPLTSAALIRRLAAVGIAIAPARTGALTSLAQQLPPVVLADLTGINIGTAIRWTNATAANNARYAGLLLDKRAPADS